MLLNSLYGTTITCYFSGAPRAAIRVLSENYTSISDAERSYIPDHDLAIYADICLPWWIIRRH